MSIIVEKNFKKITAPAPSAATDAGQSNKYSDILSDFGGDVDKLLPEAGALESAKTYREKKAKPVLDKAARLIKSLYHSVLDLQAENRELRAKFDRKENSYVRVAEHNKKLLKENVELREDSRNYQKICQAIGEDRAAEILRAGKIELIR